MIWLAVRTIRHRRANAYRRAALQALDQAGDDPAQIALVLRRTALAAFPRAQVAGLIGADWLRFLDHSFGGTGFANGAGRALTTAPYQGGEPDRVLTDLARRWITTHRMAGP